MKLLKTNKIALALLIGAVSLQSCSDDDDNSSGNPDILIEDTDEGEGVSEPIDGGDSEGTDTEEPEPIVVLEPEGAIVITESDLFPEGIDYNTNTNEFLVGSIGRGEVGTVDAETGEYTRFITDENLVNVAGIFTDEANNRLLAVSGDLANGNLAYLGIYDLTTGEAITDGIFLNELLEEGEGAFANDIAVDADGSIYVTDSFSPVVYVIDAEYNAEILVRGGEEFTPVPEGFGLNGIVYVDGYLIVNVLSKGTLFKIPVETPEMYAQIDAPEFFGGDGLEIDADGNLVVVENGFSQQAQGAGVYTLTTADGFDSVTIDSVFSVGDTIEEAAARFPTTATLASDGNIYVLNAYLTSGVFFGGAGRETFSIQRAE